MRFNRLKRREFITFIGSTATFPFAACDHVDWISPKRLSSATAHMGAAFHRGLKEAGYIFHCREVAAEIGSGDETAEKIYASYQQFRTLITDWSDVSERAVLNSRVA